MSGQGRGGRNHYQGRGNRGFHQNQNKNNGQRTGLQKKSLADYIYYIGSNKNASDYKTTTNYLINHIRKTYNKGDAIATAIEKGVNQDS